MMKTLVSFAAVATLSLALGSPRSLFADRDATIDAEVATDLLADELLTTVEAVTSEVTPETADDLSVVVSQFLASQSEYRLIGTKSPLGANSDAMDRFEAKALRRAMRTGRMTQRVVRGELRTVVPLTFSRSDDTASCATCHTNYNDLVDDPDDVIVVGAASFRVAL